ncbi:MAG: potassium channel family protein [Thermoleophilaceae bacterium]
MNERSRDHGFALVLVLVLVSATFQVAAPEGDWSQLLTIMLGALILAVSAWAARAQHRVVRAAVGAAAGLVVIATLVTVVTGDVPKAAAALTNGLLIAFAPAIIGAGLVRDIRAEGGVSTRTLSGVLAIYVLLGMFFSFLDAAVGEIGSTPFFAGGPVTDRSDYLYFSYVTLSTVGYGDLVAATDVGRALAVSEALIGQIYLVTVVALIVSNLRPGARAAQRAPRPPPP